MLIRFIDSVWITFTQDTQTPEIELISIARIIPLTDAICYS
jgi:hypothetical protein